MNRAPLFIIGLFLGVWGFQRVWDKTRFGDIANLPKNETSAALPSKILSKKDSSEMILISSGAFVYGMDKTKRDSLLKALSQPLLPIFEREFAKQIKSLRSYYIDKFEITNKQYAKFLKERGGRKPQLWSSRLFNHPDQPVVGIGWADAEAYAKWAGKRLPSEEEWEKSARGTNGRIWPWGNEPSGEKYNGKTQGNFAPVPVGSFPAGASVYGVMDMAGNVYEMTTGLWGGSSRAIRGGSYLNAGALTRTMFRWAAEDEINGARWLGFRCVMDTTMIQTMAIPMRR
jgi:formylglycine-generating enzyme required for sulfatase activity